MIHPNTIKAYHEEFAALGDWSREILLWIIEQDRPMTDREITYGMGCRERSKVQPRISDMIRDGYLVECGNVKDPESGKTVRTTRWVHHMGQLDLHL